MNSFKKLEKLQSNEVKLKQKLIEISNELSGLSYGDFFYRSRMRDSLLSDLSECLQNISTKQNEILELSTFDFSEIVSAFIDIISYFEGGEYVFQQSSYVYDMGKNKINLIVDKSEKCVRYDSSFLAELVNRKKAFVFEGDISSGFVNFYKIVNQELSPIDSLAGFDYLKDFVDGMIVSKEIGTFGSDLSDFKDQFILKNIPSIIRGYKNKDYQAEEQINKLNNEKEVREEVCYKLLRFKNKHN